MKLATALFSALALMGCAAAAVIVPEQSHPAGCDPREAMRLRNQERG